MSKAEEILRRDKLSIEKLNSHVSSFYDICDGIRQKLSLYLDDECDVEHLMSAYMVGAMTQQQDSEVLQEYLDLPDSLFYALSNSGFLNIGWERVVETEHMYQYKASAKLVNDFRQLIIDMALHDLKDSENEGMPTFRIVHIFKQAGQKTGTTAGKMSRQTIKKALADKSRTVRQKAKKDLSKAAGQILRENIDTVVDVTFGVRDIYTGFSSIKDAMKEMDNDEVAAELVNYSLGLQEELVNMKKDLNILREQKVTLQKQHDAHVSEVKNPRVIKFALSHLKWMYIEMGPCN